MSNIGQQVPNYHSVSRLFVRYLGHHLATRHVLTIRLVDTSGNRKPTVSVVKKCYPQLGMDKNEWTKKSIDRKCSVR